MKLEMYCDQIVFARAHTIRLLDAVPESLWFEMPNPPVSHIAWQVGHLAMAQYRLAVERIRGIKPEDDDIISKEFLALFVRGTVAQPDPKIYPPITELRRVFDAVHQLVLRELPTYTSIDFDAPPETEHPICKTKGQILMWCSHHEALHCGQIGILRRLFGQKAIW